MNSANPIYYGFTNANRDEQSAWFHTRQAAAHFNAACGGILGEIETATNPDPADIMDTPDRAWVATGRGNHATTRPAQ